MPKVSTLTADFTTIDTGLWATAGDGPVTATGGVLKCEYGTAAFSNGALESIATNYDVTSDAAFVQIADPGTQQAGWLAILTLSGTGSGNSARMYVSAQYGVVAQVFNASTVVFSGGGVAYSSAVHKWMQIRETAGTLFFETSTNGTNYTTLYSTAASVISGWSLTSVKVTISAQRESAQATGGYSSFDNFNLRPITAQGNFFRFFSSYSNNIGGDPGGGPPPSGGGGGTPYISQPSDIDYLMWEPANTGNPPVPVNSSFHPISTPSGPGFEFVCTDANETNWNSGNKAVLANKQGTTALGQTQDWTWDMYLPTQTINVEQYVLWEWHTSSSSGNFIGINPDKSLKLARQTAYGENYVVLRSLAAGCPAIIFDAWIPVRIQIKWSLGSDGFIRIWYNNVQVMNNNGPTQFANDGTPYLQFGWYGVRPSGVTNTVRYANIQRAVS